MVAWVALIPAAISAISTVSQYSQQTSGIKTQSAWQSYNANMELMTTFNNARSKNQLVQINAQAALSLGKAQASAILGAAAYNAEVIKSTSMYNDLLFEEELATVWEQEELDLKLLELQRAQERGAIIAGQAASGTVIGEGSNEDVLIFQKTQEALDAFVVRHNADKQAARIMNSRARNLWEGEMAAEKVRYEGTLNAAVASTNAGVQALSGLATAQISSQADITSAWNRFMSANYGIEQNVTYSTQQAQNQLTAGLFNAGSQAVSAYYQNKVPDISQPGTSLLSQNRPVSNERFGVSPGV